METVRIDDILEKTLDSKINIYDITLMKFFINQHHIKRTEKMFNLRYLKPIQDCKYCNREKRICIRHHSLNRILGLNEKILRDSNSGYYFYKNEIFKVVKKNNNFILIAFYCPHTKTIPGNITKDKIKTIYSYCHNLGNKNLNFDCQDLNFNLYFTGRSISCIFNDDFNLVLNPQNKKDIILTPNR